MHPPLPIDPVLPEIAHALTASRNVVLVAEPGSGKTTRAPVSLLDAPWLTAKRILMLEPRRFAAKAAATYISAQYGEAVGGKIGYRIRGESRVGSNTRLEVLTEGILTRIIQKDSALEETGLVIFDEFHERSVHAELALALVLEVQRVLRPDLRIMIMSATIDAEAVARLIGNSRIIECPGRQHPVEIRYGKSLATRYIEQPVSEAIRRAHAQEAGDILVFLPGRAEISRVAAKLRESPPGDSTAILSLHSDVRGEEQSQILSPRESDPRRVILATNVAETSVTIPRVRVVIDSGLVRVPRFNPRRGVAGLETVRISDASATQRAGRAGRQAPGVCYRLWNEQEQRELAPFNQPEIASADLAPVLLELAAWGNSNPATYSFMTPPPSAHVAQARELLTLLGALDLQGNITAHGKALLQLSLPPRLSNMLFAAHKQGAGEEACTLAALLEKQLPSRNSDVDCLVSNRLEDFVQSAGGRGSHSTQNIREIQIEARRLRDSLCRLPPPVSDKGLSTGCLIALTYPERLARQREPGGNRYVMRNGVGAIVPERSVLCRHEYLAIAELDGLGENARVFLAEPVSVDEIRHTFASEIEKSREVQWDWDSRSVRVREVERLGALLLSHRPTRCTDEEAVPLILEAVRERGIEALNFSTEVRSIRERVQWARTLERAPLDLPDLSAEALEADLEHWLSPFLTGMRGLDDLKPEILDTALSLKVTRTVLSSLTSLAPVNFILPSGREVPISYDGPNAPAISGRLQEMFGQAFSPRIAGGTVPLTIELLSPAGRPLQVTRDLESFWKNSYQEVRKEMAGRYPKHSWPLDPQAAEAMRGTKRRR